MQNLLFYGLQDWKPDEHNAKGVQSLLFYPNYGLQDWKPDEHNAKGVQSIHFIICFLFLFSNFHITTLLF